MHVIVDLAVVPLGVGVSVSSYVAECEKIPRLHAFGTNIEGEWDVVFAAIKQCHQRLHAMGAPRITASLRVGTRIDKVQSGQDKIDAVARRLAEME